MWIVYRSLTQLVVVRTAGQNLNKSFTVAFVLFNFQELVFAKSSSCFVCYFAFLSFRFVWFRFFFLFFLFCLVSVYFALCYNLLFFFFSFVMHYSLPFPFFFFFFFRSSFCLFLSLSSFYTFLLLLLSLLCFLFAFLFLVSNCWLFWTYELFDKDLIASRDRPAG